MHLRVIMIYICFKSHEILFSGYLDMVPADGLVDGRAEGGTEGRKDRTWTKQYPSAFGGGITNRNTAIPEQKSMT